MEFISTGEATIGKTFIPNNKVSPFDVLKTQTKTKTKTETNEPELITPNISHKEPEDVEIKFEAVTEKPEWRMPFEAASYFNALLLSSDAETKKKLDLLHFNIVDEQDPDLRSKRIDSSGLNDEQKNKLKNYIDGKSDLRGDTKPIQKHKSEIDIKTETKIESSETLEQLMEKFSLVRENYLSQLVKYKTELSQKKTGFRKVMTSLGKPERQMPEIPKSPEFLEAEKNYFEIRKKIVNKLKEAGDRKAILEFAEGEEVFAEKKLAESLPERERKIVKSALLSFGKSPLTKRVGVSSSIVSVDENRSSVVSRTFGKSVDGIAKKSVAVAMSERTETLVEPTAKEEIKNEAVVSEISLVPEVKIDESLNKKSEDVKGPLMEVLSPEDAISGKAPLPDEYQFDPKYKKKRTNYNVSFEKAILNLPEGSIDYRLPIEYHGGRIIVLEKDNKLTILLNGKKIGSGEISTGINLKYEGVTNSKNGMLGVVEIDNFQQAFNYAKEKILKAEQFQPKLKAAA